MKKYLVLFIAVISTSFFVGCDSDDDFTPPNYVTFGDVTDLSNELNVSVLEDETVSLDLAVFSTLEAGSSRTYNVVVDESSTLDPSTYTVPETVTIPANSNKGNVVVEIVGAGIANEGNILVLKLEGEQDLFVGEPLILDLLKVCPFNIANFVGTYDASEVFTAGTNEGYSFGVANGLTFEVELTLNENDTSGNSLVLSHSEGSYAFIPEGMVINLDPSTGQPSLNSDITVFGYPFVETSGMINTCAQVLNVTGELGAFGEYTLTFEKQ